jgi:hypothetical protein
MRFAGHHILAYKIRQNGEQHFQFWNWLLREGHLSYEPIPVPIELKKKMIRLMESLKINFASADFFALTANGEFVFLGFKPKWPMAVYRGSLS